MAEVKKAIIPIAGLGTRFLPLTKAIPKELLPLVDKPLVYYSIKEAKDAGIQKIIFVVSQQKKLLFNYLKPLSKTEKKLLKERKRESILAQVQKLEEELSDITFSYVQQKRPLGDGHAILQAGKLINSEPVACLFADDIIDAKTPAIAQLLKVFKTSQKPVIALYQKPKEEISHYGVVGVEKIAHRLFKIKKIVEKPSTEEAPSDLAIVGRYILTPEVFDYLKKSKATRNGEIILADVIENKMLKAGKLIYGYQIQGNWLECGDKMRWLKSHFYLSLNDPEFGPELKNYLKEIN